MKNFGIVRIDGKEYKLTEKPYMEIGETLLYARAVDSEGSEYEIRMTPMKNWVKQNIYVFAMKSKELVAAC